jgi:hypothetical protein
MRRARDAATLENPHMLGRRSLLFLALVLFGCCPVTGMAAPAAPVAPASPVAQPPTPRFATGVSLYLNHEDARDHRAITHLLDTRAAAGDSAICLIIPFIQLTWSASAVQASSELTPALEDVRFVIRAANQRGLAVMLKPLMDETTLHQTGPAGAWRGSIQPVDPAAWFASYTAFLRPLATLASQEHAAWLVIGTEFSSLEAPAYTPLWSDLITTLRTTPPGNTTLLTYSQNWDRVPDVPPWFNLLDAVSIDAYFPLHHVGASSSVQDLANAFTAYDGVLAALRRAVPGKPIYFTEVGIVSQAGYYGAPWTWGENVNGPVNLEAQRTFFAAACQYYGAQGDGLFWWVATVHPPARPETDNGFDFIGKPAEQVVNHCSAIHR